MGRGKLLRRRDGAALVTLIVLMLVMSSAGLYAFSLFSGANWGDVSTSMSTRTSYLAESGYQYLAGRYKQASASQKNLTLQALHSQTFSLLDGAGRFTLAVYPYYYVTVGTHSKGATSLVLRFPGAKPSDFTVPTTGTLGIWGSDGQYHSHAYSSVNVTGETHTFSGLSSPGLFEAVSEGTSVVQVCSPASTQTVASGINTSLALNGDAAKVLPLRFGAFDLDSSGTGHTAYVYTYQTRNGNTLQGVSVYGDPTKSFSFTVNTTSKVYIHSSAELRSTGSSGSADSAVGSTFSRLAVLGSATGGNGNNGKPQTFTDGGDDPSAFEKNWTQVEGSADIKSGGPADKSPAINLKGEQALLALNPGSIGLQFSAGGLISYDLQVKAKIDLEKNERDYYLLGISFRLNQTASHYYGVSFFRSLSGAKIEPASLDQALKTAGIKNGLPHVVMWVKDDANKVAPYRVLEYCQLQATDPVVVKRKTGLDLRDWSTLVVKVDEQFSGVGGSRQNHISAYIQGTAAYPREKVLWPEDMEDLFIPVQWHAASQPIIDATLTTADRSTGDPEIGLHGFSPSNGANDLFFDDFSLRTLSGATSSGGSSPGM